jgi:hypothetical protein
MTKRLATKKRLAFLMVSTLGALSMPTMAAAENENPSGDLTVGVTVYEDPSLVCGEDVVSLSINDGNSSLELTLDETFFGEPDLFGVLSFRFMGSQNLYQTISDSFSGSAVTTETLDALYAFGSTLTEVVYSTDASQFAWDHPADINGDGKIDLVNDVPPILLQAQQYYSSESFGVSYDVDDCQDSLAGLWISRSDTQRYVDVDWASAELTDWFGNGPWNGQAAASLFHLPENSYSWKEVAFLPNQDDLVTIGTSGLLAFQPNFAVFGNENTVGQYQVTFSFDLEVNSFDYFVDNREMYCLSVLDPATETFCNPL